MANTPSGSVSTTSKILFAFGSPTYFVLHADSGNTANIQVSFTDPTAITDYEEIYPGQSVEFEVEPGDVIYIVAASGTQKYTLPVFKSLSPPSTMIRGP